MKMRPLSAAVALLLAGLVATAHADDVRRPYIVQLNDKPVASYTGDISGLPATQPTPGNRLDIDSSEVHLYSDYLDQKKTLVRASVANAPVTYEYNVVLNGFAALLTDDEVRTLQARSDVLAVTPDVPRQVVATDTSTFLGLDKSDGMWAKLGGQGKAGENMIIAVVDTGVWPENPSYADRVDANGKPTFDTNATLAYSAPPSTWKGICQPGEGFTVANCNNKLIGAQFFDATFTSLPQYKTHWSEFRSPRDSVGGSVGHGGHGSHTSSTAAGNANNEAFVNGIDVGIVSGVAPRARIAMYKVCWTYNDATDATGGKNSCFTGDSVAAIEKAVVDGANVITFSIGGGSSITDPVEQAFLHASNAGVFVSAAGGNDGPANAVSHISPWLTTVAASTHNRMFSADVTLGNGAKYTGASLDAAALPSAPIITAEAGAVAGANATAVSLCYTAANNGGTPVLDPAKVTGKIVTCTRGTNGRLEKSQAVKDAGGVGMIEIDNGSGLVAEVHAVPTIHVTAADGAKIKTYAQSAGATAEMSKFYAGVSPVPAPVIASFSSRGPNQYDPNQLKPDLTAPGVDVIAAVSPGLTQAQRADVVNGTAPAYTVWDSYQGTSMATPHIAGMALLLKQQHPDWTPSMIKSAMMTTATDTFADTQPGDLAGKLPFGQGAGHININAASDPGLVFPITNADYVKYECGIGAVTANCNGLIAGYNLNLPSVAIGNVLGAVTVTRTVTNVGASPATYTPSGSTQGFSMSVSPSSLVVAPGESKQFTLTLTRTTAPTNAWQYGKLVWSDGSHTVRMPIVARAGQPVVSPDRILSTKASASKTFSVGTGFSGTLKANAGGLKEISRNAYSVGQAGSFATNAALVAACNSGASGTLAIPVTFPTGTLAAQFELFNRDTDGNVGTDLDLYLISGNSIVALSGNEGSDEMIAMKSPASGSYKLCVVGYAVPASGTSNFTLSSAVVTTADKGGNFKLLMPAKVIAGSTASVNASWSGLATGKRYLGAAQLLDANGAPASTTVFQVETNNPIPLADPVQRATQVVDAGI